MEQLMTNAIALDVTLIVMNVFYAIVSLCIYHKEHSWERAVCAIANALAALVITIIMMQTVTGHA